MLQLGSLVDNKYKILSEVGHGGMSVVYLAINERANKTWAVKEIRKDGICDFDGGYEDYMRYKEKIANTEEPSFESKKEENLSDSKKKYLSDKKNAAEKRKRERRIVFLGDEIEKTEKRLVEIEEESAGSAASDHVRLTELYEESQSLEEYMMACMEELEELEKLESEEN